MKQIFSGIFESKGKILPICKIRASTPQEQWKPAPEKKLFLRFVKTMGLNLGQLQRIDCKKELSSAFVFLNVAFKKKLFEKAQIIKNKKELSQILGFSLWQTEDILSGRRNVRLHNILRLAELTGISDEEIFKNANGFTARAQMGTIKLQAPFVDFDAEFAEWLGLVKGDGCIGTKYVFFSNTVLPLVFFFATFLEKKFGIKKEQFEMTLKTPLHPDQKELAERVSLLKEKGFSKIIIETKIQKKRRKKMLFVARVYSRLLAKIIKQTEQEKYFLLKNSQNKVKQAFIRGFCAAEGSVTGRRVAIAQNNVFELDSIKKLMISLGFNSVKCFDHNKDKYRLCIYSQKELRKFALEIGFGLHEKRNQKLRKLLESYVRADYKPRKRRYCEITSVIKKSSNKATANTIKMHFDIGYKTLNQYIQEMLKQKILLVDKKHKPYFYSIR